MPESSILMVDALHRQKLRIRDSTLLLTSHHNAPWEDCVVELQRLPATETPEIYMENHLLSIQLTPTEYLDCNEPGKRYHFKFQNGDVYFNAAHVPTRCQWEGQAEVLNMALMPVFVAQYALENFDVDQLDWIGHAGGADIETYHLGLLLKREMEQGYPNGRLYGTQIINALVIHLLKRYTHTTIATNMSGVLDSKTLKKLRQYIYDNLSLSLTITDLAHAVNLSPYYFAHSFKATLGVTPHQYVMQCRLDTARQLLLNEPHLTLIDIATRTGFSDHSHLIRHFKRAYGITPRTLRSR